MRGAPFAKAPTAKRMPGVGTSRASRPELVVESGKEELARSTITGRERQLGLYGAGAWAPAGLTAPAGALGPTEEQRRALTGDMVDAQAHAWLFANVMLKFGEQLEHPTTAEPPGDGDGGGDFGTEALPVPEASGERAEAARPGTAAHALAHAGVDAQAGAAARGRDKWSTWKRPLPKGGPGPLPEPGAKRGKAAPCQALGPAGPVPVGRRSAAAPAAPVSGGFKVKPGRPATPLRWWNGAERGGPLTRIRRAAPAPGPGQMRDPSDRTIFSGRRPSSLEGSGLRRSTRAVTRKGGTGSRARVRGCRLHGRYKNTGGSSSAPPSSPTYRSRSSTCSSRTCSPRCARARATRVGRSSSPCETRAGTSSTLGARTRRCAWSSTTPQGAAYSPTQEGRERARASSPAPRRRTSWWCGWDSRPRSTRRWQRLRSTTGSAQASGPRHAPRSWQRRGTRGPGTTSRRRRMRCLAPQGECLSRSYSLSTRRRQRRRAARRRRRTSGRRGQQRFRPWERCFGNGGTTSSARRPSAGPIARSRPTRRRRRGMRRSQGARRQVAARCALIGGAAGWRSGRKRGRRGWSCSERPTTSRRATSSSPSGATWAGRSARTRRRASCSWATSRRNSSVVPRSGRHGVLRGVG